MPNENVSPLKDNMYGYNIESVSDDYDYIDLFNWSRNFLEAEH